jgi:predicted nucleotide-binding protein
MSKYNFNAPVENNGNTVFGDVTRHTSYVMKDRSNNMSSNKRVFIVHGRNMKIRNTMFDFLIAVGLEPMEWNEVRSLTGKGDPTIHELLDTGFTEAHAILVLFTPDDEARLKEEFISSSDDDYEKKLTPQARPNVLFEAGMAKGYKPDRTILV